MSGRERGILVELVFLECFKNKKADLELILWIVEKELEAVDADEKKSRISRGL